MQDALQINVTGRVMLALSHHGLMNQRRLAIFVGAVCDAVRSRRDRVGDISLDALIDEQIAMLEQSLSNYASATAMPTLAPVAADPEPVEEPASVCPRKRRGVQQGPVSRTMEEKLKEDREPVQKLLAEDCVTAGLIDPDKARSLVAGMLGKQPDDAEREIVEYLREVLLQQVKAYIRSHKGGPWSAPRVQADLRSDIHRAQTVRGVLMLSRQVIKERREWEKANGHGGILGLFAGRH